MSVHDRVVAAVEPAVTGTGLVLEAVELARAGARTVVRVVIDLPDGAVGSVSSDQIATASRAVSAAMDGIDDAMGAQPYVLEVGSPGVSRPLTERRHWSRARTRLVLVRAAGVAVTGRVVAVGEAGVELDVDGASRVLPWADLGPGRVQVEFNRPGADGADDDEADEADDDEADGADDDEADGADDELAGLTTEDED